MVVSPKVGCFSGYRKFFWFYFGFVSYESSQGSFPRGILQISSDRDDRRILGGLKFSIPEFFGWEILASIFFGWLDLSSDFLRGIQNNLKICGKACVSRSSSTANKVQPNFFFFKNWGVNFWSSDSFWVLLEALRIF